jgi:hypothetical protein
MYYYLYEIYIADENSTFYNHYYYGKHRTSILDDGYYGSGIIIKKYIAANGTSKLRKTILSYYDTAEELDNAEYLLVKQKREELGALCLNLAEGGKGGWTYVNSLLTDEQKKLNALAGGLGNKKRLEDPKQFAQTSERIKEYHRKMSVEKKTALYEKIGNSRRQFNQTDRGKQRLEEIKLKNIQTNKETSKQWRSEFKTIFGRTPESFRKYGKLQESLSLFKTIKNLSREEQINEVNRFMESISF